MAGKKGRRVGKELIALEGGPWNGRWFWIEDFEAELKTEQAARERGREILFPKEPYRETERYIDNPDRNWEGWRGRVWAWPEERQPRRQQRRPRVVS